MYGDCNRSGDNDGGSDDDNDDDNDDDGYILFNVI